jgi:uncharacterized protein YdeI (YjbR/CyaY-like superfamily)
LFKDEDPIQLPKEIRACLENEPPALTIFFKLPEPEQLNQIKWISAARTDLTKAKRNSALLDRLLKMPELIKPVTRH